MVARRQGIILDGFGADPADGGCGVFVLVGGGGEGLGSLLGSLFRCNFVCRGRGLVIAVTSASFVGVRSVTVPTASPSAISSFVTVSRWRGSSFGRR